ncbi:MAG: hypothetical protein P9L91_03360, partial [Candidatus Zophobacter franzmannii]|nr:hypothetical protein [Candidatus Zophobacter franzmannii]
MKRSLLIFVIIGLIFTLVADIMPADTKLKPKADGKPLFQASHPVERDTESGISWEMPFSPSVIHGSNYYDYMIGSYCSIPIKPQPENVAGRGWFYNFMAKPSSSGNRRVYYGWMDDNGPSSDPSLFTTVDAWEGYPGLDVDNLGHMIMGWHSIGDDGVADVKYGYDSFFAGIPGISSDAFMLMDNPTNRNGFDDNEYIWPNVQIGDSPLGSEYQ